MRKVILIALFSVLIAVADISPIQHGSILMYLNFSLLWCLLVSAYISPKLGVVASCVSGLFLDASSSLPFGIYMLSLLVICVAITQALPQIVKRQALFLPLYSFFSVILLHIMAAVLSSFLVWLGGPGFTVPLQKELVLFSVLSATTTGIVALCIILVGRLGVSVFRKRFFVSHT